MCKVGLVFLFIYFIYYLYQRLLNFFLLSCQSSKQIDWILFIAWVEKTRCENCSTVEMMAKSVSVYRLKFKKLYLQHLFLYFFIAFIHIGCFTGRALSEYWPSAYGLQAVKNIMKISYYIPLEILHFVFFVFAFLFCVAICLSFWHSLHFIVGATDRSANHFLCFR